MLHKAATDVPSYLYQVHRGIKGVIRDKDTDAGIADAIIKVDDIDHHIRSGERETSNTLSERTLTLNLLEYHG